MEGSVAAQRSRESVTFESKEKLLVGLPHRTGRKGRTNLMCRSSESFVKEIKHFLWCERAQNTTKAR
jgi:hypothetical protein